MSFAAVLKDTLCPGEEFPERGSRRSRAPWEEGTQAPSPFTHVR